jgi:predicted RNA binding protein YcfA (HicA-like mRNA interferase family)
MNSRNVINELKSDGWYEVNHVGSHKQFKHATTKGRVTVTAPEQRHTDWNFEKHRKAGLHQTDLRW